jgi:hypothetical protein
MERCCFKRGKRVYTIGAKDTEKANPALEVKGEGDRLESLGGRA